LATSIPIPATSIPIPATCSWTAYGCVGLLAKPVMINVKPAEFMFSE